LPALAFGSHYSVFKERPGTHQSSRCWCRVCRRTVPDELLRRRVSFGCRRALGRPFRRECHDSRRATERQRVVGVEILRARPRIPASPADRSGTPAVAGGCPPERPGSRSRRSKTPSGHAGSHPAFRMPPGARSSTGSGSHPSPTGPGSVRHLLMPSIYRMSPRCDACMLNRRCCRAVTGR